MTGNVWNLRRYSSQRVERFATSCVYRICLNLGYNEVSQDECKIIANACDLKSAVAAIRKSSPLRHNTKYGQLIDPLQKKLNMKLAICDMVKKPAEERIDLLVKTLKEYEEFLKRTDSLNIEHHFILDLLIGLKDVDVKLGRFLREVDTLYIMRKTSLRRAIDDEGEFLDALEKLTEIFSKRIAEAVSLAKQRAPF